MGTSSLFYGEEGTPAVVGGGTLGGLSTKSVEWGGGDTGDLNKPRGSDSLGLDMCGNDFNNVDDEGGGGE